MFLNRTDRIKLIVRTMFKQIKFAFKSFLAFFRLNLKYVCKLSNDKIDYHDYPDSLEGKPYHMISMVCKRCGKKFTI